MISIATNQLKPYTMKHYKVTFLIPKEFVDKTFEKMLEEDNAPHDHFEQDCILFDAAIATAASPKPEGCYIQNPSIEKVD